MATTLAPESADVINVDPEIMSGTPVFIGTRVPIKYLWDYLIGGDSLDVFLDCYPTVSRDQAVRLLEAARDKVLANGDR